MSDFRELPLWKQARLLAMAGHELAQRLRLNPAARAHSVNLQTGCISLLTAIVNRYEGELTARDARETDSVESALARLESLLAEGVHRGSVKESDYRMLYKTITNVKALL